MSLLESIIEQAVIEAAMSYGQAVSEDAVLFDIDQGGGFSYVLVSGKKMVEALRIIKERMDVVGTDAKETTVQVLYTEQYLTDKCILGIIDVDTVGKGHALYSVGAVAAEKGYGPLLYDLAMKIIYPSWLTSDRTGKVEPSARAVWDYYNNNRPEVERKDLVGKQAVETFTAMGLDYLNKAFRQKGVFMKLFDNREKVVKAYVKFGVPREFLSEVVSSCATVYFEGKYNP